VNPDTDLGKKSAIFPVKIRSKKKKKKFIIHDQEVHVVRRKKCWGQYLGSIRPRMRAKNDILRLFILVFFEQKNSKNQQK